MTCTAPEPLVKVLVTSHKRKSGSGCGSVVWCGGPNVLPSKWCREVLPALAPALGRGLIVPGHPCLHSETCLKTNDFKKPSPMYRRSADMFTACLPLLKTHSGSKAGSWPGAKTSCLPRTRPPMKCCPDDLSQPALRHLICACGLLQGLTYPSSGSPRHQEPPLPPGRKAPSPPGIRVADSC